MYLVGTILKSFYVFLVHGSAKRCVHAVVIEASFLVAYLYICLVTSNEVTSKIICACSGVYIKEMSPF